MAKRRKLNSRALALLRSYGISKEAAIYAGLFSVENAMQEMRGSLEARPAVVISYFDVHGEPVNSRTTKVYFPRVRGLDWAVIAANPIAPILFVNDELRALALCVAGTLAIAVMGYSEKGLAEWLRERGAKHGAMH